MSNKNTELNTCSNPVKINNSETIEGIYSNMKIIQSNFRTALNRNITTPRKGEIANIEGDSDKKKISLNSNYNTKIDNLENTCIASCQKLDLDDKIKTNCITSCDNLATKYTNLTCEKK